MVNEITEPPISIHNFVTECGKNYVFEEIIEKDWKIFYPVYPSFEQPTRFFQVNGFLQSSNFLQGYENFLKMKIRDDDVWICSFPRSGTTWIAEMVWCIMNHFDFETAKSTDITLRIPYVHVEINAVDKLIEDAIKQGIKFIDLKYLETLPSPRIFWSHSAFIFLPLELQNRKTNAKIIYAIRDAKDVCFSSYSLRKSFVNYPSTFDGYCDMFLDENNIPFGPYWKHVESYLVEKSSPNIFISRYEDKIKDLRGVIKNVANFLEKEISHDKVDELYDHLRFDNMKNNPQVSLQHGYKLFEKYGLYKNMRTVKHIREGKIGQGKLHMNVYNNRRFNEKIASFGENAVFITNEL